MVGAEQRIGEPPKMFGMHRVSAGNVTLVRLWRVCDEIDGL